MAAWDAVENRFALPIPSVASLFADRLDRQAESRRRSAQQLCDKHPQDTECYSLGDSEITQEDETKSMEAAQRDWKNLRRTHIDHHGRELQPHLAVLDPAPA